MYVSSKKMDLTYNELIEQNQSLERQLEEYKDIVDAIKNGSIDALAIKRNGRADVFSLESSDYIYRILVENFAEGALNVTDTGLIVFANTAFENLIGSHTSALLGSSIEDLVEENYKDLFKQLFSSAFSGNSKGEIVIKHKNKKIPVYISLSSLYPKFPGIGIIITDLSEKKMTEKVISNYQIEISNKDNELLEAEIARKSIEIFRFMADVMPQKVWTSDPVGNIDYFNKKWLDYTQLSFEELKVKGLMSLMHPDDIAKSENKWKQSLEQGEQFEMEHRFLKHDGTYRWHLSRAIPEKDAKGRVVMWVGTNTDIHEQKNFSIQLKEKVKERTAELEIKNQQLEKSNKELELFNFITSHDLQEPLRKIRTFMGLISEADIENLSEESKIYFDKINTSAIRMQRLIKSLVNYSQVSLAEPVFVETDLNKLVEKVRTEIEERNDKNSVIFKIYKLPVLKIIPIQFKQLFANLFENSIKYRNKYTKPEIIVSSKIIKKPVEHSRKKVNYWQISVSDNGIGFDMEYATKIFTLFQRLHDRTEYEGTGIGLAICKKVVENHGGSISAYGKPGIGAIFQILIPQIND